MEIVIIIIPKLLKKKTKKNKNKNKNKYNLDLGLETNVKKIENVLNN